MNMPNFSDPFDRIVAGAGMGEWPDPGYETIPPHKIEALQTALLDHLVASSPDLQDDEEGRAELHAQINILYGIDFHRLGILKIGDRIRFSRRGFLLSLEETGSIACDLIDDDVYVEGVVVGPVVMPAPVLESLQFSDDTPEPIGHDALTQIAACVEIRDVVVGGYDSEADLSEPFEVGAIMTCMPLVYEGMKIQRKL